MGFKIYRSLLVFGTCLGFLMAFGERTEAENTAYYNDEAAYVLSLTDPRGEISGIGGLVYVGESGLLSFEFSPVMDIDTSGTVKYISSDPSCIQIDDDGSWKALKEGDVRIYFPAEYDENTRDKFNEKYDRVIFADVGYFLAVRVVGQREQVYRLYNCETGEHLYTTSVGEQNFLINSGWTDEGISWMGMEKSNAPVYRLYNPNAGDHFYTCNQHEKEYLLTQGWYDEGVSFWAMDELDRAIALPVYRMYNSNAISGAHHYTTNRDEVRMLVKFGWKEEGIAWYYPEDTAPFDSFLKR